MNIPQSIRQSPLTNPTRRRAPPEEDEAMHHLSFDLPFTHPILIFTVVLFVILFAPLLLSRFKVPGIIGLILAGAAIGPHGFHVLERDASIVLFSTVGLLYIMFLAGLEIDLNEFRKNRNRSLVFGCLTFVVPMTLGILVGYYGLGFPLLSAILLASMFASHTLLAYPTVSRLGIVKSPAITVTVGGTMITDTAALLVLAVIAGSTTGELNAQFWLRLLVSFGLFSGAVLLGIPWLGRWFFKSVDDAVSQYLFVLACVFLAAFLAEVAGVEGIIGAFFGGLALNRLIPHTSPLMNRIEFVGNAIFVPFFLINVGMLVDFRVLFQGPQALIVAIAMLTTALVAKWLAATLTQKALGYTRLERDIIFGLSSAQAAATLAAVMVGYQLKLFDESVLNGTIFMILGTCLVSSYVVERRGRVLALKEAASKQSEEEFIERVLVPIANPETIEHLIELAIMIKQPSSKESTYALAVVPDDIEAREKVASSKKMLERAIKHAAAADKKVEVITRVDLNVANGILRAAKDLMATEILIGWNARPSARDYLFGSVLDQLLQHSPQMILVCRIVQPLNSLHRVVVAVPPHAELEPGFQRWTRGLQLLIKELGAQARFFVAEASLQVMDETLQKIRPDIDYTLEKFDNWEDFLILSRELKRDDLFVIISARRGTLSHCRHHEAIPGYLSKYYQEENFLVVYPEQLQ